MKIGISFFCLILFLSCSNNKPDETAFLATMEDSLNTSKIDKQVIVGILEQIPSPLELSILLKKSGVAYNGAYLNPTDNMSKYSTSYKQALNLGVYGTDLGYTNIYEKKLDGVQYLSSIKSLANELHIGQFFDLAAISKLVASSDNLDSLLLITTQNFNSINSYLQDQGRENLSILFLIGGWIEAMQITCEVAVLHPGDKELMEVIGAQKIVLEQIILLLTLYDQDPALTKLLEDFKDLEKEFSTILITYTYKQSTMEVVDGVAVIKDNSTTSINITNQNVTDIRKKVTLLRNKIIS